MVNLSNLQILLSPARESEIAVWRLGIVLRHRRCNPFRKLYSAEAVSYCSFVSLKCYSHERLCVLEQLLHQLAESLQAPQILQKAAH